MSRFEGTVAVVTGAARGIGAASARRLAAEGAAVLLVDVLDDVAGQVADEIRSSGGQARFVHGDVASEADWAGVRKAAHEHFGPVGVVHSNAYIHRPGAAHELTPEQWSTEIAVNLDGLYLAARTFVDDLREQRGALVATSSVHARFGLPGHPAYAASKGGICALVRQLAVEYGPAVRVNAVLPGPILTAAWSDIDEAERSNAGQATALQRMGSPEEVAAAVAFLCSAEASYITGVELYVDGGWSITKDSR
ncbi:SDR family NAD(P)-dependent oxidoreductase [Haloactinopolyspora sp.]|uniref:SDR family NAD(P)-dependent oxidoreductase n=1 Tax=Haloactinopolyspora sp. TaxID=1966353 RepID=UPI0026392211|nr:SDR family NAD(P)-dependent oxidoreductase [Haloactinopolyspora sp.]